MAYTTIDDPSAFFQAITWTGNDTDGRALTNDGNSDLKPDWVWLKNYDLGYNHFLTDSSRGVTKQIYSDVTTSEGTWADLIESFDTDGFTIGYDGGQVPNKSSNKFVAWQWKANGGTTATNSDGSTDTTVQANTTAGFSIVTFTTDGGNETYGHGLGVKPDIVIVKSRSGAGSWIYMTDVIDGSVDYLLLNTNAAAADLSYGAFTSSTFQYNDNNAVTQLAYCFASKQGYSKCGKFVGNGAVGGPFIYTGFKPAFVMIKNASATESWVIYDTKRSSFNPADLKLSPDTDDSENNNSAIGGAAYNNIDILSNGFKCVKNNAATNGSGNTLIFMAFAENPFVTSTGIPTTAR